jgi:hypothetical protein
MRITNRKISGKTIIFTAISFVFYGGLLTLLRHDVEGKVFFNILSLISAYYAFHGLKKETSNVYFSGLLTGLALVMLGTVLFSTYETIRSDSQFDYMCFYMQGQLGIHNLDFYDPASFTKLLKEVKFPFTFDTGIRNEILNIGFLSPPITMLFFAPLAFFDYNTSRMIFSLAVLLFIFLNSLLANHIFLKKERTLHSLLFIFILLVLLPGTGNTIHFVQTNFFLLFFLLLTYWSIEKPVSGMYLALSTVVKPISGILILFFLFNKRWGSVLLFGATTLFLVVLTGSLWGFHNIFDFLSSPPTDRLPQFLYEQDINQSLIAVLNRNLKPYGLEQPTVNMIYNLISLVLAGFTILVSLKLSKINLRLGFLPFLPFMLMVYPSSLHHYSVYLILIVIYFMLIVKGEMYLWIMIIPAAGFMKNETFFTYLTIWLVMLYFGLFRSGINFLNNKEAFPMLSENPVKPENAIRE